MQPEAQDAGKQQRERAEKRQGDAGESQQQDWYLAVTWSALIKKLFILRGTEMYKKMLCLLVITALSLCWLGGCKEDTTATEEVKTDAEYKDEAEKEITDENVDKTLEDIEKQVDAELTQE